MKKTVVILLTAISCISCSPFYQLYQTSSLDLSVNEGRYTYSDDNMAISYDLWSDGGDGNFILTNKTDDEIFIDLDRSHMVINGYAMSYFLNSEITLKEYSQLSVSNTTTSVAGRSNFYSFSNALAVAGQSNIYSYRNALATATENSMTLKEKRHFSLPPRSYSIVSGYHINQNEFQSCGWDRSPIKKEIRSLEYERATSPIVVRNFIVYSNSETFEEHKTIENEFWVSKITNYPESEFIKTMEVKDCGKDKEVKTYQFSSPSSFYVKYTIETSIEDNSSVIYTVH